MNYTDVTVHDVSKLLELPETFVIDMRDEYSFIKGHLDGAHTASEENIKNLIKSRKHDIPLVVYCYHGNSSKELASFFTQVGFKQVYNLVGGWDAWDKYQQAETQTIQLTLTAWLQKCGFDTRNLNSRIENGMSPVMAAALEGEFDILKMLIQNNADLNLVNDDENNALWFACFTEDLLIIDLLIQHGINIDHQNVNGATSLIYAASAGKQEVIKALINAGADTNKMTLDGFTALDSAATLPILKLLRPLTTAA